MQISDGAADGIVAGNYYGRRDYLTTDVSKGVTRNASGTRMIALTEDFLIALRDGLVNECGDAADQVLKTCGRRWGGSMAARLEKELGGYYGRPLAEMPMAVFQACLTTGMGRHGWGRLSFDLSRRDAGFVVVTASDTPFARLRGSTNKPAEPLLAGVLAGLFSRFSGQELDCLQTECIACGAPAGRFVLGLARRMTSASEWAAAGKTHDEILSGLEAAVAA